MKKILLSLAGVLAITAFAPEASAVPAFARQTGKACTTCHFQSFPALNDYGQDFKASGYTEVGKQGVVKGDDLSLPAVFNASLFVKARYQKSSGADADNIKSTHSGEIQFPDEFALLLGGRITENMGFLVENQFAGGGTGILAGFKVPMMYGVGESGMKAGVVPFLTDALGASYGFELLNTGAVRNVRVSEHRNETSSHQYVFFNATGPLERDDANATVPDFAGKNTRLTAGAASGLAFALYDPSFHVVYTKYTPHHLAEAESNVGGLDAGLIRAVWTPTFGDFMLGVGVQSYIGTNMRVVNGGTIETVDTKGTALDVQAQGVVGDMPVGVYFTHATAPGSTAASTNLFNANVNERKAMTLLTEFGIVPNKVMVLLAYRIADNGATANSTDNAWTVGGKYHMAQNVQLSLNHSVRTDGATGRYGDDGTNNAGANAGSSMTTFMLAMGF